MLKIEAAAKIRRFISYEAQVITPKGLNYREYIDRLALDLLQNTIIPVKATVVSTCVENGDIEKYKGENVWAIARVKDNWLLTIANEDEFALAFGSSSDKLMLHGFSSSDVLAEWNT